jgi:hypothetical protein
MTAPGPGAFVTACSEWLSRQMGLTAADAHCLGLPPEAAAELAVTGRDFLGVTVEDMRVPAGREPLYGELASAPEADDCGSGL